MRWFFVPQTLPVTLPAIVGVVCWFVFVATDSTLALGAELGACACTITTAVVLRCLEIRR